MVRKILLVDPHEVYRRGLVKLLEDVTDLMIVGHASTSGEAWSLLVQLQPDLVVVEMELDDSGTGTELVQQLRHASMQIPCVILTDYGEEDSPLDALLAGADGYATKDTPSGDLIRVMRHVANGEKFFDLERISSISMKRREAATNDPAGRLNEKEKTVLRGVGEGLSNKEIAEYMYLSEKTVKIYMSRILQIFGANRRTQLVPYAIRLEACEELRRRTRRL